MKKLDINKYLEIQELTKNLKKEEPIFFMEGLEEKFVLIDALTFKKMKNALEMDYLRNPMKYFDPANLEINVIADHTSLTLAEYEQIKTKLIESLEKTLKPKTKYKINQS